MNVLLQFNPEQADKEFTEFYRCCVYRTAGNFPTKVTLKLTVAIPQKRGLKLC